MVNSYTINIKNESGSIAHYALFTAAPEVTGLVAKEIWSNVFATADVGNGDDSEIVVYKQYFAILGHSKGTPAGGVTVKVSGKREVTLGTKNLDNEKIPGTTHKMVTGNGIPEFEANALTAAGEVGAFQFRTDDKFDLPTAQQKKFVIGLGGSQTGDSYSGPSAVFVPKPNQKYQIKPKNIFFLTTGSFTAGDIIDVTELSEDVLKLDFSGLGGSPTKNVTHTDHGKLVISG